ncbi:Olfactory Receptor 7E24 [Manis pentadactyla]|nr:Olfactory Receptor 7E24 [Manis pentadactyla]
MYSFLSSLSLDDTGFSTTTVPKMLVNIQTHSKSISHAGCFTQVSFFFPFWVFEQPTLFFFFPFFLFGFLDGLLLAVMAYDRFMAICHPLHYPAFMRPHLCGLCQSYKEPQNLTGISEFLLLGLSEDPGLQPLLFGLFLSMYLVTVLENLLIILAIGSDPHLHTPMYFLLSSLSLADIGFTSTIVPKMLVNIQTHSKSISYAGCLTQVSFSFLFGCVDSLLLTVMVYDWLVAICHPLQYVAIMNPHLCGLLVLVSFLISLLDSQIHCLMVSQLSFCTDVEIPHFFCDIPQLVRLARSDTSTNTVLIYFIGAILEHQPLLFGMFLSMHLVTMLGNLLIILAVGSDPHLHNPMYFFLSSLSLADIGFTSTTVPKMLVNIQTQSKSISYSGCLHTGG